MSTEQPSPPLKRTSTIVTIVATVVGTVIAYLSLAAAVKWPPFAPEPAVAVFRGGPVLGNPNCPGSSCAYVGVKLTGFDGGSTVRCEFDSSDGSEFFEATFVTVDDDGSQSHQTLNYFGTPAGWVGATCKDVTGALDPWGAG